MKKRLLLILLVLVGAIDMNIVLAEKIYGDENIYSIGTSLNNEQMEDLRLIFDASDEEYSEAIKIDGTVLNNYLQDGSNESTNIYSSAKVAF